MNLPSFLIVGAQKSGTTSLHAILAEHPQANMSTIKEVNYFINESKYKRGLGYYASFFEDRKSRVSGESSPGYLCHPGVAEKIKKDLGNIRIIILLRDPVKRGFSQYWDNRRHLSEWMSEEQIIQNCLESNYVPGRRGYFSRGVYAPQVKKYFDLFGQDNVKVVFLEELVKDQKRELSEIYKFLGLDTDKGFDHLPPASNASQIWENDLYRFFFNHPYYNKWIHKHARRFLFFGNRVDFKYNLPSDEVLSSLHNFYRPFNQDLERLLGRQLPW